MRDTLRRMIGDMLGRPIPAPAAPAPEDPAKPAFDPGEAAFVGVIHILEILRNEGQLSVECQATLGELQERLLKGEV